MNRVFVHGAVEKTEKRPIIIALREPVMVEGRMLDTRPVKVYPSGGLYTLMLYPYSSVGIYDIDVCGVMKISVNVPDDRVSINIQECITKE